MPRPLTIVADDYGIGPETSRGILDLALEGRVTAAVLIVNCLDAERAASAWCQAAPPANLGWHPNLTLDRPVLPPEAVPSLVQPDGRFWSLGAFLKRVALRQVRQADVEAEWDAQFRRFVELVGQPPDLVNSHQHVSLFGPCDRALADVLNRHRVRPYVRRVVEHGPALRRVPGARLKRTLLSVLGRRAARQAIAHGWAGCDWLAGVTDPSALADGLFWSRWFEAIGPAGSVEVCCHPGYLDRSLVGRDCGPGEALRRRPRETALLRDPGFAEACARHQLTPTLPSRLGGARP